MFVDDNVKVKRVSEWVIVV